MTEKFRFREKGMYRLVNAVILTGAVLFGGAGFVGIGQMNAWLAAEAAILLILSAGLNFLPVRGKLFCLCPGAVCCRGGTWRGREYAAAAHLYSLAYGEGRL